MQAIDHLVGSINVVSADVIPNLKQIGELLQLLQSFSSTTLAAALLTLLPDFGKDRFAVENHALAIKSPPAGIDDSFVIQSLKMVQVSPTRTRYRPPKMEPQDSFYRDPWGNVQRRFGLLPGARPEATGIPVTHMFDKLPGTFREIVRRDS